MLKNSLFQPSLSFSFNAAPFFFFSVSAFFFLSASTPHLSSFFCFCFLVSRPFSSSLFFQPSFSFLQVCCPLFFSPKYFFFSPKTLFSAQNVFASAQKFFQFSPKRFFFQFSHSSLLLFSVLFFSGSSLFFLFQRLLFFFSLAPFIQDPMFSLAASHLFYLNKSLFSSNLE